MKNAFTIIFLIGFVVISIFGFAMMHDQKTGTCVADSIVSKVCLNFGNMAMIDLHFFGFSQISMATFYNTIVLLSLFLLLFIKPRNIYDSCQTRNIFDTHKELVCFNKLKFLKWLTLYQKRDPYSFAMIA